MFTKLKAAASRAWAWVARNDTARRAEHTFWQTLIATGLGAVVIDAAGIHVNLPIAYAALMSAAAAALSIVKGALAARWGKSGE